MKLKHALQILAKTYHQTKDEEVRCAIRIVAGMAIINDELGIPSDADMTSKARHLLNTYMHLYPELPQTRKPRKPNKPV